MPDFEFEFNQQDKDLIVNQTIGQFSDNDYMRLTIYPSEAINNVVQLDDSTEGIDGRAIFFSTLLEAPFSINISPFTNDNSFETKIIGGIGAGELNDFKIYKNPNGSIYIKPNEIFNKFELPQGDYRIQIDFLNQFSKGQLSQQSLPIPFWFEDFDFNGDDSINAQDAIGWTSVGRQDIASLVLSISQGNVDVPPKYYSAEGETNQQQQGEGQGDVETNPLRGVEYYYSENLNPNAVVHYNFIIKQISTSRKEVRLKILDEPILNDSNVITNLTNELNQNTDNYQFKHVLNIGTGDHNPIMNYTFDAVTDGKDNQSIILKLYEPLAGNVTTLSPVTIEKEILTTQTQDIFYFSDVPDVFFGDGLEPDPQENWLNPDGDNIGFENYDEIAISSSIENTTIDSIISSSEYGYPNLNTDFNEFSNHTFFGSAKKKLQNFKTKVETIQTYYSDISSSLISNTGISMTGDSSELIQRRKNLFEKIDKEFKTFTPYERFLYFDGQSDTTASAPSLTNYADTKPVRFTGETLELSQHNGFNTVYKFSSEKISSVHNQFIHLFTNKYKVQNKPFFNYSGSIYLSFLLQGDSGSALSWDRFGQTTAANGLGVPLPKEALHQNRILDPLITGSEYRRFVYEASQSYWIPNQGIDFMDLPTINGQGELIDSSNVTFLHTNIKTGSYQVKDSTNKYPTTVVTQSGVPFFGSCMPAGELFRVYNKNTLSSSLQGYWNVDDVTSGSGLVDADVVNDAGPTFGDGAVNKQVSASSGVEVHGRQYGSSYFMISESGADTGVHFDSLNYNYNKEDNFSMAIWVKRSHPTATNADPSDGTVQGIFTRGHTVDSYGIDYDFSSNKIRAGIRPNGGTVLAQHTMTDDLLDWHHVAFTYQSGSSTGIKLYVDGDLKANTSNETVGDFSASSANASNNTKLTIGGNDVVGGSARNFSGFLQYPRIYDRTLTPEEVNQLYLNPTGITETKITDVKVTLKDPTDVLPFDTMFKTTSTEFTDWYNGMLTNAENFDTDNIHSFENNLPLYIQQSSEYNDMKDFLNLQGEQYDLIRNHIDSMGTLHDRGYKETNSPPNNTLPMLLSSMGWQGINPFEGNLTETLGSYLSGITSIDDIKNNTWRKTLNNLLYIYKSKGTKNSVRALLNTYGYPPDVLNFKEFGGAVDASNQDVITNNPVSNDSPPPLPDVDRGISIINTGNKVDTNLDLNTGSFNFTTKKEKLHRYRFAGRENRILNLDWWMNEAKLNTFEFIYKHDESSNTQTILKSSGSEDETLWDLRIKPSSNGASSSFEFRLNNSLTGSDPIASNAISMSTPYTSIKDGQIWNVMLQRINPSIETNITHEYRLHSALQDNKTIETYNYITMSVAGASSTNELQANQNFIGSGSRDSSDNRNLFVGETLTGSLGEIRGWSTALSTSKFRQHVFNKFSIVGNTLLSHCKELRYHFKLNENYGQQTDNLSGSGFIHPISSSTQDLVIKDSAAKHHLTTDYTFTKKADIFLTSSAYGFDIIDNIQPTLQSNESVQNDNNIIINPSQTIVGDLESNKSSVLSLTDKFGGKSKLNTSTKLELYNSPQDFIDNFILGKLAGFNLEKKFGNPLNFYSQSYEELDLFRNEFFDCYPIEKNINKFISSQESMLNHSLSEGLKQVAPARSTFSDKNSNFGVEIKPTILEKQKYEHHRHSVETNPNRGDGEIDFDGTIKLTDKLGDKQLLTIYDSIKEGEALGAPIVVGTNEIPHTDTISLGNTYVTSSGYLTPISQSHKNHFHPPFLQPGGYVTTIENPHSASFIYSETKGQKNIPPTLNNSTYEASKDGTIDYASIANESYTSVHKNWGTTESDVHFINFAAGTGSRGDYNVGHIDTRFVFHSIGDNEYYSSSLDSKGGADFSNSDRFYNRLMIDTDFHMDVSYESLIGTTNTNQTGRMMGKTRYFITSSDGSITFPSNHITKFSQPFKTQMNNGTQNVNPGQLNVQYEDYSTASFYSVKVTGGENQIRVNSGRPSKGGDDKIIYD